MRLLLTAFEPFGRHPRNASQAALDAIVQAGLPGIELHTAVLPVDAETGPESLLAAHAAASPEATICLGQAAGRAELCLERVALNLRDYEIPDNAGKLVRDEPVVAGAPAAYFSSLPLRRMLSAMREAGAPSRLSLSAGSYLCNQVYFVLSHVLAERLGRVPVVFLHVPLLPEQARFAERPVPTVALETICAGVRTAIYALRDAARNQDVAP